MNFQDLFFILMLISFLLVSIIKAIYWKHARLLYMGVIAQRYSNQYLREENAFIYRLDMITFLLMIINFVLIAVKIETPKSFDTVLIIFIVLIFYYIFKQIIIKLLGQLFKQKDLAKLTAFFSLLFDKTFGFVITPFVVISHFFIFDVSDIILILMLVIFILFFLLKLFWFFKLGRSSFGLSSFYIFLYLCIIEISPVLLLTKAFFY
tara:strand:- start:5034 stop:5654 length:621 start_codon:yes stop_codon:yes gene_type:complete